MFEGLGYVLQTAMPGFVWFLLIFTLMLPVVTLGDLQPPHRSWQPNSFCHRLGLHATLSRAHEIDKCTVARFQPQDKICKG